MRSYRRPAAHRQGSGFSMVSMFFPDRKHACARAAAGAPATLGVILLLLSVCLACAPKIRDVPPLALEYQGRGWSMEDVERNRRIQCDLPPGKVYPGPYPYIFQLTRSGEYYLLLSLVLSTSETSGANRLEVVLDDRLIKNYVVGESTGEPDRLDILPENPAVIRVGHLDEGSHTLEFRADAPEKCCVIHWGVANEIAIKEFWQRRSPWLERPL